MAHNAFEPVIAALDSLGVGACVFDQDDRLLLWNGTFVRLFAGDEASAPAGVRQPQVGDAYEEMLHQFYDLRLHALGPERVRARMEQTLSLHRAGLVCSFEHEGEVLHSAARRLPGVGSLRLYHVEGDAVLRRQQHELREKSAQLETALSSMGHGIFMVGADGRIGTWNRKVVEMLDIPAEFLDSKPTLQQMTRFQLERGDFGPGAFDVQAHARAYVAGGAEGPPPDRYLRTTKAGRVLEVATETLPDGGMVRTFTDVTDHMRAQEEIRRLNDELEGRVRQRTTELADVSREMDAFSYSIAHDLRQPLSSIDGFSALLAALLPDQPGSPARHYVNRIRAGVRQMSALTDGLLSLAYLSRKKLSRTPLDLGEMAQAVVADLAAREPDRRVQVDIQSGLHAGGERMLMRQVLENLIGNAWKFSVDRPNAKIVVGKLRGDDGETVFFVSDDGVGFDMAHAGKLFGAFQRLHSPGDFSGMGIGLAIAHRIVTRHGGRIWANSAPGEGATFFFTLGRDAA